VGRGEDAIRRHVQRAIRELMTHNRPHTEILTVPGQETNLHDAAARERADSRSARASGKSP
jgi:hypothetical protein